MRGMVLAVVAVQIGLALSGRCAKIRTIPADRSARRCRCSARIIARCCRDLTEQLFCGDPELNAVAAKLNAAIQDRLNRLANRRLAIEENAEWIRERNSSCGIFGRQSLAYQDVDAIKACLLKETRGTNRNTERSEFRLSGDQYHRRDADMQRPLAGARQERAQQPGVGTDRQAERRRRQGRASPSTNAGAGNATANAVWWARTTCRWMSYRRPRAVWRSICSRKTAEIVAAKGDAKKVFGRHLASPLPDADAVDLCVAQIHAANACENFLTVSRVFRSITRWRSRARW